MRAYSDGGVSSERGADWQQAKKAVMLYVGPREVWRSINKGQSRRLERKSFPDHNIDPTLARRQINRNTPAVLGSPCRVEAMRVGPEPYDACGQGRKPLINRYERRVPARFFRAEVINHTGGHPRA